MADGVDPYMVSTFVLSAIIVAVGLAYVFRDRLINLPAIQVGGLQEFAYVMVLFLPHVLMFFGPIADALSQEFRYTIPSLAGFFGIFVNYAISGIFKAISGAFGTPPPAPIVGGALGTMGCHVPGFDSFVSEFSSAPLVVTFTVAWYYLLDLWQNRGFFASTASMLSFTALAGSQFWILRNNGCFSTFSNTAIPLASSLVLGLLFGGTTYGIVKASDPSRLPSAVALSAMGAPITSKAPNGGPKRGGGGCSGGTCGAPTDDDQFVCDTYVNGMPVKNA